MCGKCDILANFDWREKVLVGLFFLWPAKDEKRSDSLKRTNVMSSSNKQSFLSEYTKSLQASNRWRASVLLFAFVAVVVVVVVSV